MDEVTSTNDIIKSSPPQLPDSTTDNQPPSSEDPNASLADQPQPSSVGSIDHQQQISWEEIDVQSFGSPSPTELDNVMDQRLLEPDHYAAAAAAVVAACSKPGQMEPMVEPGLQFPGGAASVQPPGLAYPLSMGPRAPAPILPLSGASPSTPGPLSPVSGGAVGMDLSGLTCPVCNDRVSGFHYGKPTCESCKGFFKRSIQNKKEYRCVGDGTCEVSYSNRKRCPNCRFQKCIRVGMNPDAVREDRMRGGRHRAVKDQQQQQQQQHHQQMMMHHQQQQQQQQHMLPHHPPSGPPQPPHMHTQPPPPPQMAAQRAHAVSQPPPISQPPPVTAAAYRAAQADPAHMRPGWPQLHDHPESDMRAAEAAVAALAASMPNPQIPPSFFDMHQHSMGAGVKSEPVDNLVGSLLTADGTPAPQPSHAEYPPTPHKLRLEPDLAHHGRSEDKRHVLAKMEEGRETGAEEAQGGEPADTEMIDHLMAISMAHCQRVDRLVRKFVLSSLPHFSEDRDRLFRSFCHLLEQLLFCLVEWSRATEGFQHVSVDDQMELLNSGWSEYVLIEFTQAYITTANSNPNEAEHISPMDLVLSAMELIGETEIKQRLNGMIDRFRELELDPEEFTFLKYLVLFNPSKYDVQTRTSRTFIEEYQMKICVALMAHILERSPNEPQKFGQLLLRLPEVKHAAFQLESFLYQRYQEGHIPLNTLLAEMLLSKRK